MQFNNIKDYALNFIQDMTPENYRLLKKTIEQLKQEMCHLYLSNPHIMKIIGNHNLNDTGLYLELLFISVLIRLNFASENGYLIKKVSGKKYKTIDFLISNHLGDPKALFECTTFNLSYQDTVRINNVLKCVLVDQNKGLTPIFILPETYITNVLGSDSLKTKVKDKCLQFDEFITNNSNYKHLKKYIILDLTWYVFDNRIRFNAELTQVINVWKDIYQIGKNNNEDDFTKQDKFINVITELKGHLLTNNVQLILLVNNNDTSSIMVLNENSVYLSTWHDVISGNGSNNSIDILNFTDHVIFGKCENLLFDTNREGGVSCSRYLIFINAFFRDFIINQLMHILINKIEWQLKLADEIIYYKSVLNKYPEIEADKPILEKYESRLNGETFNSIDIIDLFHTLHYFVERLYVRMKALNLIGRRETATKCYFRIQPDDLVIDRMLENGEDQHELVIKYRSLIEILNLKEFNQRWENDDNQFINLFA